jgi:hypothetical protein
LQAIFPESDNSVQIKDLDGVCPERAGQKGSTIKPKVMAEKSEKQ